MYLKPLLARLNPTCHQAFEYANQYCSEQQHKRLELEHVIQGLLQQLQAHDFAQILKHYEIYSLAEELNQHFKQLPRQAKHASPASLSPFIMTLLRESWLSTSLAQEQTQIRSAYLLLNILEQEQFRALIRSSLPCLMRIPPESLRQDLDEVLKNSIENPSNKAPNTLTEDHQAPETENLLERYATNLVAEAKNGKLDPILGRDHEIQQLVDILCRRRQNNPILLGESGVGKTAIVEGLALKLAEGNIAAKLANVQIYNLDLGLLQAGASVQGEFENRLKAIIEVVKNSQPPTILFIDEAHSLIGAGGQAGSGDAANLLKPALARGELRTIAATTWREYKSYIEKDPALARRFQAITVKEPDEEQAMIMLRGIANALSQHHQVTILEQAIRATVRWSKRYISGRQLPDKAINLLDTAAAQVAVAQQSETYVVSAAKAENQRLKAELQNLHREQRAGYAHQKRITELERRQTQVAELLSKLEQRQGQERLLVKQIQNLEQQLHRQHNAITAKQLAQYKDKLKALQGDDPMIPAWVDNRVIAQVIASSTGIPVGKMLGNELDNILNLKQHLRQSLIGQDAALAKIAKQIQNYRAGLDDPNKPTGVFLLSGGGGVGKTETALQLAQVLYGGEQQLISLNMSEYQESYAVSALKGAPPGYVGHGKGGILTEAVRRRPYSVILLDEIDKAHPDVLELLYPIFDKGQLEDSEGTLVDFSHSLIILTTHLTDNAALQQHFKSSLLNRLVVIPYRALDKGDLSKICELKLQGIVQRILDNYGAQLHIHQSIRDYIINSPSQENSGARHIDHVLEQYILPELSCYVLQQLSQAKSLEQIHLAYINGMVYCAATMPDKTPTAPIRTIKAIAPPPKVSAQADVSELLQDLSALLAWLKSDSLY